MSDPAPGVLTESVIVGLTDRLHLGGVTRKLQLSAPSVPALILEVVQMQPVVVEHFVGRQVRRSPPLKSTPELAMVLVEGDELVERPHRRMLSRSTRFGARDNIGMWECLSFGLLSPSPNGMEIVVIIADLGPTSGVIGLKIFELSSCSGKAQPSLPRSW